MTTEEPEEWPPTFDSAHDPKEDLAALARGIETAEWLLRLGEFAELGGVTHRDRRYSVRVNGREHEAPHVDIRCGRTVAVRIFLGRTPGEVAPDNRPGAARSRSFDEQIRNRETRRMILDYVRTHHQCLLDAWVGVGNPAHRKRFTIQVDCPEHRSGWPNFREGANVPIGAGMNAALDQGGAESLRDLPSIPEP